MAQLVELLVVKLPADMEEKIVEFHRFVLRARRRHDYQLSHILNTDETPMRFELPATRTLEFYGQPNSARRSVDVAVIPGGLTSVLQPSDNCINKPFKAELRILHEIWMVNGPFTHTPSGKKRAPSKELVLTWIDPAWNGILQDLTEKSFKSCGIANALDGSEEDAVLEKENVEREDAEEIIDNEFETVSEGKEGE